MKMILPFQDNMKTWPPSPVKLAIEFVFFALS